MSSAAVFLDRDGTLVEPRHYPSTPEELVLVDGIGPELRALREDGFKLVLITNQGGIARGLFGEAVLAAMHDHLRSELAAHGVVLDGVYHCPHHPEGVLPHLSAPCACRKPQPGMLLQAAGELDLNLPASWFVGDILDDVEAGNRAGCGTVLVDLGTEGPPENEARTPTHAARDTLHALRLIRAHEGLGAEAEFGYIPPTFLGAPRLAPPWIPAAERGAR